MSSKLFKIKLTIYIICEGPKRQRKKAAKLKDFLMCMYIKMYVRVFGDLEGMFSWLGVYVKVLGG